MKRGNFVLIVYKGRALNYDIIQFVVFFFVYSGTFPRLTLSSCLQKRTRKEGFAVRVRVRVRVKIREVLFIENTGNEKRANLL